MPKLKLLDNTDARACIAQFIAPVMPENVEGAKSIMEMVKKKLEKKYSNVKKIAYRKMKKT